MRKEWKICLPLYKIGYSLCFIALYAMVRGISSENEIGIVMQTGIGALALVFCADTYECEFSGKRWEIFSLRPHRQQVRAVCTRLLVQMIYLCILSLAGYGMFYWQRPRISATEPSIILFAWYIPAAAAGVMFWGVFSVVISSVLHNMMAGIAVSLVLWLTINSTTGEQLLGKWSVFSYSFRNISAQWDKSWLCGTVLAVGMTVVMAAVLPWIIKLRRSHAQRSS